MTSKQIYELSIKMGIESDLRGKERVKKYLERIKKKYDKLETEAKKDFDQEKLINPYSDSRFLVDNNKKDKMNCEARKGGLGQIKKVMIGIDMGGVEMLLARELGVDLVIGHHPSGKALADLSSVMELQAEVLADYGVPINIAEQVIKPRIEEVNRGTHPINNNRWVDFAKLIKLDYMCLHTTCDNLAALFIKQKIENKNCEYVEDILEIFNDIEEYKQAKKDNMGPKLFVGSPENHCGKIAVTEFTGGTSGSKDMYKKMSQAGIGTIIGMHMGEEHRKQAEKYHINIVIAGHMPSDSLGVNLFVDALEKEGIEIVPVSGFIRFSRN